jgi:PKHD-type hydroxylase
MKYDYMTFENIFSLTDCLEINEICKNNFNKDMYDLPAIGVKKSSTVNFILWKNIKQKLNVIEKYIELSNNTNYNFDIFKITDNNYVTHNNYSEEVQSEYDWHSDLNKEHNTHFKLTVLLNISTSSYTGGEFQLFLNKPTHIKQLDNIGSMLIFPTYLQHKVTPILKGKRTSLALWLEGPKFK